jgi:hypothetical protein
MDLNVAACLAGAVLQSSHTWLLPHVMVAASAISVMLLQSWLWRQAESAENPERGWAAARLHTLSAL